MVSYLIELDVYFDNLWDIWINDDRSCSRMTATISDLILSDPMWLHVLSFIGDPAVVCQMGCVSRRWYRLSRDVTLWRRVNFTERRRLSLKKLAMFIHRPLAAHMHSLRVEGFVMSGGSSAKRLTVSPALLKNLHEKCPLLTELHLVNAKMDNVTLDQFPTRLTALTFVGSLISFDFLAPLHSPLILPRLTAVDLSYVHNLSSFSKSIDGLLSRADLTSLRIGHCSKINAAHLLAIPERLIRLQTLDVSELKTVTDDFLVSVAAHCPDLRHLNVSRCDQITDRGLLALANGICRLLSLYLKGCPISDVGLSSLSSMVSLKHVHVDQTWCTDNGFNSFKQRLPHCHLDRGVRPTAVDSFVWQQSIVEDVQMT